LLFCNKLSKASTKIENLEGNLEKVEDDLRYMFRLDLEGSKKEAAQLRRDLRISKDEEKKD
jgi:C4-type Zn-finger protein